MNTVKMKRLVVGIASNTSGTAHKDRQIAGRAESSFKKKLTRAKELTNGVRRVNIESHSSNLQITGRSRQRQSR